MEENRIDLIGKIDWCAESGVDADGYPIVIDPHFTFERIDPLTGAKAKPVRLDQLFEGLEGRTVRITVDPSPIEQSGVVEMTDGWKCERCTHLNTKLPSYWPGCGHGVCSYHMCLVFDVKYAGTLNPPKDNAIYRMIEDCTECTEDRAMEATDNGSI